MSIEQLAISLDGGTVVLRLNHYSELGYAAISLDGCLSDRGLKDADIDLDDAIQLRDWLDGYIQAQSEYAASL